MVDGDNVDIDVDVDNDDDADDVDDDVDVEQCKVEGARVRGSFHVGGILSYLLMMLVIVAMTTPLIIMLVSIMYLMGCGFTRLDFSYLVNIKIYIIICIRNFNRFGFHKFIEINNVRKSYKMWLHWTAGSNSPRIQHFLRRIDRTF